jgi:hypothetical protein
MKHRGGPISRILDWFMVDPTITGIVLLPLVIFGVVAARLSMLKLFGVHAP